MVMSHHDHKLPGRSKHTMCPERFEAMLHVCRSSTLTSTDGTRHFGDTALHLCIQSTRNVRTDCMSRPPTCTSGNHDVLSCIRQIPPVFRKWFARHVLDTNAGEALQSTLTFTTGIFQHPPRLHRSIFKTHSNMSLNQPSDWTCGIDNTSESSQTWKHTPWPHAVFLCFDDSLPQHLSSIKRKIEATTSTTNHLILAFLITSTLTWKELRKSYGATCLAIIPTVSWMYPLGSCRRLARRYGIR